MGVWRLAFGVFLFFFFFFFCTRLWDCGYCLCTVQWTVAAKFDFSIFFSQSVHIVHYSWTHKFHFSATFSLKLGPTVLFTYLKIILLQYFLVFKFQFSAISKRTLNISFCLCFYTDDWHLASKRSKGKKNSHLFIPPTSLSTAISNFLSICLSLSLTSHSSLCCPSPFSLCH